MQGIKVWLKQNISKPNTIALMNRAKKCWIIFCLFHSILHKSCLPPTHIQVKFASLSCSNFLAEGTEGATHASCVSEWLLDGINIATPGHYTCLYAILWGKKNNNPKVLEGNSGYIISEPKAAFRNPNLHGCHCCLWALSVGSWQRDPMRFENNN